MAVCIANLSATAASQHVCRPYYCMLWWNRLQPANLAEQSMLPQIQVDHWDNTFLNGWSTIYLGLQSCLWRQKQVWCVTILPPAKSYADYSANHIHLEFAWARDGVEWSMVSMLLLAKLQAYMLLQAKTDEYTMHHVHPIKYCHVTYFGSALGLAGLAVVWQVASQDPYGLAISPTVFKVSLRLFIP